MDEDLRVEVAILKRDYQHMREKVDRMAEQVDDLHELMTKAKGARWAILTFVAIGGFVAGKLGSIFPMLGIK